MLDRCLILVPVAVESVFCVALWHLLTFLWQSQQTPSGGGHSPTKPPLEATLPTKPLHQWWQGSLRP